MSYNIGDMLISKADNTHYGFKKDDKYFISRNSFVIDVIYKCFYVSGEKENVLLSIEEIDRIFYTAQELRKIKLERLSNV